MKLNKRMSNLEVIQDESDNTVDSAKNSRKAINLNVKAPKPGDRRKTITKNNASAMVVNDSTK